jgi:hypothetical protein
MHWGSLHTEIQCRERRVEKVDSEKVSVACSEVANMAVECQVSQRCAQGRKAVVDSHIAAVAAKVVAP